MREFWLLNGELVAETIIYVNGEFVKKTEAKISVYDSGFQHGDAVYEGIRAYGNKVFMLEEHVKRLYESCKAIDIRVPMTQADMIEIVKETVRRNIDYGVSDIHMRLQVTRGLKAQTGMHPNLNISEASVVICVDEKPPIFSSGGIDLITSILRRSSPNIIDAKIHSCNQLNQIMAVIEAQNQGADEAIMLDVDGFVAETNSTTLIMVKDNEILMPTGDHILVGITRQIVKEIAVDNNIKFSERNISIVEFYNADEAFVCGTVGEITPVKHIDYKPIGAQTPGKITSLMSREFKKRTEKFGIEV